MTIPDCPLCRGLGRPCPDPVAGWSMTIAVAIFATILVGLVALPWWLL